MTKNNDDDDEASPASDLDAGRPVTSLQTTTRCIVRFPAADKNSSARQGRRRAREEGDHRRAARGPRLRPARDFILYF
jgi:hypothetical protein